MAFNKNKNPKLVYGVGVNDAAYPISSKKNRKQILCPIYSTWKGMFDRCYGQKTDGRNKTYIGCSVSSEWIHFSKFSTWVTAQLYWGDDEVELDKDLLVEGNNVYSSETCLIVPKVVNNFFPQNITEDVGVTYFPNRKKPWRAKCGCGKGNDKWVVYFATKKEAQHAYLQEKTEKANTIAKTLKDKKVKDAFLNRLEWFRTKMMNLV
jgi:hypothetical protein